MYLLLALSGFLHFFKVLGISSALFFQLIFSASLYKSSIKYLIDKKVLFCLFFIYVALNLAQALVSDFSTIGSLLISARRIIPILLIGIAPVFFERMLIINKKYYSEANNLRIQYVVQLFFLIAALISYFSSCISYYYGTCFLGLKMPSHISLVCVNASILLIYLHRNLHKKLGRIIKHNLSTKILYFVSILNIVIYFYFGVQSGTRSFTFVLILTFLIFLITMLFEFIRKKRIKNIFKRFTKIRLYFYSTIFIFAIIISYIIKSDIKIFSLSLGALTRLVPSLLNPYSTLVYDERLQNWDFLSILNSDSIIKLLFGNGVGSELGDWNTYSIYDSFYNLLIVDYGIVGLIITLSILLITFLKIKSILQKDKLFYINSESFKYNEINNKILTISLLFLTVLMYSSVNEVLFINGGVNIFISSLLLIALV